jgi:hypothetical protein
MRTNIVMAAFINLIRGNRPQAVNYLEQLAVIEHKSLHRSIARQLEQLAREAGNQAPMVLRPLGSAMAIPEDLSKLDHFIAAVPQRTLDSLILPHGVVRAVTNFLRGWQHRELLATNGLPSASTILLYGPTGNGKTSLAEAIASSLSLQFLTARGEELIMSHIGDSEKRIAAAFTAAKKQPCVAFFDEADSFACARSESCQSADVAHIRAVNQTLLEVERAKQSASLFVFATNGPERLDAAFRRRMDCELELPAPDDQCRQTLIDRLSERWPMIAGGDWEQEARGAENLALIERLAREAAREIVLSQCA